MVIEDNEIMNLGITGLYDIAQSLEEGGIYIINTSDFSTSLNLAITALVENQQEQVCSLWLDSCISYDDIKGGTNSDLLSQLNKVKLFQLNEDNEDLKEFAHDLWRNFHKNKSKLSVLLLDEARIIGDDVKLKRSNIRAINSFAKESRTVVLTFIYGVNNQKTQARIINLSKYLSGVTSVLLNGKSYCATTHFWNNKNSVVYTGSYYFDVMADGIYFRKNGAEEISARDERDFYIINQSYIPNSSICNNINVFKSNKELYEESFEKVSSGVCIFTITDRLEISVLAEYIYNLRRKRGNAVVILVYECIPGIRAVSEKLLLASGANFIFNSGATHSYMNAVIECFIGTTFNRPIKNSFTEIVKEYNLFENFLAGFMVFDSFYDNVIKQLTTYGADVSNCLIVLNCSIEIDVQLAIEQFVPIRSGDICTICGNKIVIFFPYCSENDLSTALSHTFRVAPKRLFRSYLPFFDSLQIKKVIREMRNDSNTKLLSEENEIGIRKLVERTQARLDYKKGISVEKLCCNEEIKTEKVNLLEL